jgi:hypothetical protein
LKINALQWISSSQAEENIFIDYRTRGSPGLFQNLMNTGHCITQVTKTQTLPWNIRSSENPRDMKRTKYNKNAAFFKPNFLAGWKHNCDNGWK